MDLDLLRKWRNSENRFAQLLNIETTDLEIGHAVSRLIITEHVLNPIGSVHGGCLFTLADCAAGMAASSHGIKVTTVNASMQYLRPAIQCRQLFADATEIKHGKRISHIEVKVTDEKNAFIATGNFTYISLDTPLEVPTKSEIFEKER